MTPGYNGQVVGRECNCEDFPCCGHGLTQADLDARYNSDPYDELHPENFDDGDDV